MGASDTKMGDLVPDSGPLSSPKPWSLLPEYTKVPPDEERIYKRKQGTRQVLKYGVVLIGLALLAFWVVWLSLNSGTAERSLLDDILNDGEFEGIGDKSRPDNAIAVVLRRKQVGNPDDYFDRNFMDYKNGFQSKGETWMGLEALHQLTSQGSWSLHIKMVDYDQNAFVAVYDQFKVGPGDDYTLNVGQYNQDLSTLGDSLNSNWTENNINGMKFTTWDKDQDGWSSGNCASRWSGGWWYNRCMHPIPQASIRPPRLRTEQSTFSTTTALCPANMRLPALPRQST